MTYIFSIFSFNRILDYNGMRNLLFIVLSILSSTSIVAQSDYALFPKDSIIYSSEQFEFPIKTLEYDTIGGVVYQVLHPTYHAEFNSLNAYLSLIDSNPTTDDYSNWKIEHWMGANFNYDSNGVYQFENRTGEEFTIYTQEEVGYDWIFVEFSNGDYIEATVDSINEITDASITDSVKYISFEYKDSLGISVPDTMNTISFIVSKHNGVIQSLAFYEYPYLKEEFERSIIIEPLVDIEETNRYRIWNAEIGDEFHSYIEISANGEYWEEWYKNRTVLITGKNWELVGNKFTYTLSIKESLNYIFAGPPSFFSFNDTVTIDLNNFLWMDELLFGVDHPVSQYDTEEAAKSMFNDSLFTIGQQLREFYSPWYPYEDHIVGEHYVEGCYGLYVFGEAPLSFGKRLIKLVYIKKGDYTWGSPYNLNVEELSNSSINMYPNPGINTIVIDGLNQNFDDLVVNIYDIGGGLLNSKRIDLESPKMTVDVSFLPAGIYFVEIKKDEQFSDIQKLIIKR